MPTMPIHFGSKTDAFSNKKTINYYRDVLRLYGESEFPNPVVFITKKSIPGEIIDIASNLKQKVLFYLSLSGLGGTGVEPNVKSQDIVDNFVHLKSKGLTTIHYWRPFLPQNSGREQLDNMLALVSQYASCSVAIGLRLSDGIREHILPFWPELAECTANLSVAGEFWPQGVREYLMAHVHKSWPNYPVYFGNTPCSVASALRQPDLCGHYDDPWCKESNCLQRTLCSGNYRRPYQSEAIRQCTLAGIPTESIHMSTSKIQESREVSGQSLTYLRFVLRFPVVADTIDHAAGYNWAHVQKSMRIVEVPWRESWIRRSA